MFKVVKTQQDTNARAGLLNLPFGQVETPCFMPVGTAGIVKALDPADLEACGYNLILGNTYHLYLRPGMEVIGAAGGLRTFSSWSGNILTDSGGFQVFSLSKIRKITEQGVAFASHIDGSKHLLTPEKSIQIQQTLASNIIMAFDECPPHPCNRDTMAKSLALTHRWAERSKSAWNPDLGHLFGIVQGGEHLDMRTESAQFLQSLDLPGYAIGGVSVGEPKEIMEAVTCHTAPQLPEDKPRYLMGVGTPEDIRMAVAAGVDMFDCVLPTRNGRMGTAYTTEGRLNIKNARFKNDFEPLDPSCPCPVCQRFTRSYLRHLFMAKEVSGLRFLSLHNLWHYKILMKDIRAEILAGKNP